MYEWILYVLSWLTALCAQPAPMQVQYVEALPQDFVGMVACEAAYTTLLPKSTKPVPGPVDPANCPTCKGTGKVPTGDSNHPWTKCPTCKGGTGGEPAAVTPPPPVTTPAVKAPQCTSGTCPAALPQVSSPAPQTVPQPYSRRQVLHVR